MTALRLLLLALLLPASALASVWGGFDTTRVNYSGGVISNGNNHVQFRSLLSAAGDSVAASTSTLTSAYLNGVDVFYTSLAVNSNPTLLSTAEQQALSDWVAAGGVLIISADIFGPNFYTSVGAPFGIGPFTDPSGGPAVSISGSHPLATGVSTIQGTTYGTWTSGAGGLVLGSTSNGPYAEVYDASTGWTTGGAILVLGDHNMFTDSFMSSVDNTAFFNNIIDWAAGIPAANVEPTANAGGPYTGDEGVAVILDGTGSTDSDGAIVSYDWDCTTDGVVDGSGSTFGCTFLDDGVYTATLVVTDDGGATNTATATVTVANLDPTLASASIPNTGDIAEVLSFSAVASDVTADPLSYSWDFGDGASASGASVTHDYATAGSFSLVLTVTDGDGGSLTFPVTVAISNPPPSLDALSGPATLVEGSAGSFSASTSDVGGDTVTVTWAWGDGTADSAGDSLQHTFADDGSYTVTVTATDSAGGTDADTLLVTVTNVAPTITSTPGTTATEGATYTYTPTVTDPGAEVFSWSLIGSPSSNTSIDSSTGVVTWTPDTADALQGSFSFGVEVSDGDGGTDSQSWTVTVTVLDTDGDGLPDWWESANGLDPNDASDATADPDADGISNADEFSGGTDPQQFDGPTAPVAVAPLGGDTVLTAQPDLMVDNATDPQGDVLTYTFEVYADAALTTLVASVATVAEDASGQTTWTVGTPLTENGTFWWRAAASDANATGPWSVEQEFGVNATPEAPTAPGLTYPVGGEIADSVTPLLTWTESSDPEGDALAYDVEVRDANDAVVASATGLVGDGTTGEWTVDVALAEDAAYFWTARAVDAGGLTSDWAADEEFLVSEANDAPPTPLFVEPDDEGVTTLLSPELVATEVADPEGSAVIYRFDVDASSTFDSAAARSADVGGPGTGEVTWDLESAGVGLEEHVQHWARVQAIDGDGIASPPDVITFFVRGDNDAPDVPVLVSPEDGTTATPPPTFEAQLPTDPEGDEVLLAFVVARDADLTDIVEESGALEAGVTTWTPTAELPGEIFWSARAADAFGAESDWAAPWSWSVEAVGDDDDDDDDDDVGGCDCQSSQGGGEASLAWLALLGLAAVRRRR